MTAIPLPHTTKPVPSLVRLSMGPTETILLHTLPSLHLRLAVGKPKLNAIYLRQSPTHYLIVDTIFYLGRSHTHHPVNTRLQAYGLPT